VVSSDPHRNGRIDFDNLNGQRRPHKAWDGYSQSKLANLLIVFEVQRRLTDAGSRVRAVAADPGYAATHFQGRRASPISNFFAAVANRVVAQSDTLGALPTLYAAAADVPGGTCNCIGPDGFRRMRGHPAVDTSALQALDAKTARRLWELSEQLTRVSWP
jgi:hypothetical protein